MVKGVGHLGHDEAMEVGGREFDPRPWHYSRMSFLSNQATGTVFSSELCLSFIILNIFGILFSWGSSNHRPPAPFLCEVASHVKNCHFGD